MKHYVQDYQIIQPLQDTALLPIGNSASPKNVVFHIYENNSRPVQVLDIGFGEGGLGQLIKSNPQTAHWQIDGVDGWEPNCSNKSLIDKGIYRNIWCGLVQNLSVDQLQQYNILCLLDVIEHLNQETATWLMRTLLTYMADDAALFVSTPLWFFPQDSHQENDLEAHLVGIPASSMMAMIPTHYAVNDPLIGGFVYSKKSLDYIEFFKPTADRTFSYEKGMNIVRAIGMRLDKDTVFRTNLI